MKYEGRHLESIISIPTIPNARATHTKHVNFFLKVKKNWPIAVGDFKFNNRILDFELTKGGVFMKLICV